MEHIQKRVGKPTEEGIKRGGEEKDPNRILEIEGLSVEGCLVFPLDIKKKKGGKLLKDSEISDYEIK